MEEAIETEQYLNTTNSSFSLQNNFFSCVMYNKLISAQKIKLCYICIVALVGLIGNSLSMLVFSSKEMRALASSAYLLILSISDSVVLVFSLAAQPETYQWLLCMMYTDGERLFYFFFIIWKIAGAYSSFIILAFTTERFIAIHKPLYYQRLSAHPRPYYICLATIFAVVPFIILDLAIADGFIVLGGVVFFFLPCIGITVLNTIIVYKLWQQERVGQDNQQQDGGRSRTRHPGSEAKQQATLMLFLISGAYLTTYIPYNLVVFMIRIKPGLGELMKSCAAYTVMLYITGFSVNFALYTLSGTTFRMRLKSILIC